MKRLSFTLMAAAVLAFAGCSKQYDTVVSNGQTGGNNGFNWTGTAPLSAVVNGADFYSSNAVYT
ncbi:MAG: hypothetical protein QM642_11450 [Edaphocola sp.]